MRELSSGEGREKKRIRKIESGRGETQDRGETKAESKAHGREEDRF